jgi:hypothetical protein
MRGGGRQGKKGGEGIYERGFRREEETRRSTKGDQREGTGGGFDSLPRTTNMAAGANYMRIS